MEIRKFTHSARLDHNRRLFALIGEFCASDVVREALGDTIASRPGQVWFVAVKGRVVHAFGSIRMQKTTATALLRHLYSPVGDDEAWEAVLRLCIDHARGSNARSVRLTDYFCLQNRYLSFGFTPYGNPKGRFLRYLLPLEPPHGA